VPTNTGNIYTSGMTDVIEIPTANLRFSTTASSKKYLEVTATSTDSQKMAIHVLPFWAPILSLPVV